MLQATLGLEALVRLAKTFKSIHTCVYYLNILDGGYSLYVLSKSGMYRAVYTVYQPQASMLSEALCLELTEGFIKSLCATRIKDAQAIGSIVFTTTSAKLADEIISLEGKSPEAIAGLFEQPVRDRLGSAVPGGVEPKVLSEAMLQCPIKQHRLLLVHGMAIAVDSLFSRAFCLCNSSIELEVTLGYDASLVSAVTDTFEISETQVYGGGLTFKGSSGLKLGSDKVDVSAYVVIFAEESESDVAYYMHTLVQSSPDEIKEFTLEEFKGKIDKVRKLPSEAFDPTSVIQGLVTLFPGYKLPQTEFDSINTWLSKVKGDSDMTVILTRVGDIVTIKLKEFLYFSTLYQERDKDGFIRVGSE